VQHRLIDEFAQLVDFGLDSKQPLQGQRRLTVGIDRIGDATDCEVLNMRRFRAENGDNVVGDALIFQRLQIMGRRQQIDLRRQFHRRMAPIATGENAELTAADEGFQLFLNLADFLDAIAPVVGQCAAQLGRPFGTADKAETISTQSSAAN
jgi:hypothetical protein